MVAGSDVAVDNGVFVDATLATNVPGIFAAGDVARHDHPVFGPIRVEHYDNAVKMGEKVARNMLGRAEVFDDAHWFWSNQYDTEIQDGWLRDVVGRAHRAGEHGGAELRGVHAEGRLLLSAFSMNRPRDVRRSMALIRARVRCDPSKLADPECDLRTLAPSMWPGRQHQMIGFPLRGGGCNCTGPRGAPAR